jgi:predicted Zn-dependent protease
MFTSLSSFGSRLVRRPILLCVLVAACAVNPATGRREFMLVSESQEIAMGRQSDPQIVATYGLVPDSGVQRYVRGIGERLAANSERPQLPWTFRVLDDPTVNAFALPGGYNYVTRGIMAYLDSEAELASVMGHELGHVTARHSASQMSQMQLAQVGLVAGMVFMPKAADFAGLALAGMQLMFLRFSRDDERQADQLGLRYMAGLGYAPSEMPKVYTMLNAVSGASSGDRLPTWLSTHPDPEDRERRIAALTAELPQPVGTTIARNAYLQQIDGMVYGQNPREGFFRDAEFLHPDMRFRLTFPSGWATSNQKTAVMAQSADEAAFVQLTLTSTATPDAAVAAFLEQDGVTGGQVSALTVSGLQAARADFGAQSGEQSLRGIVAAVSYDGQVYQIVGVAAAAQWGTHREQLQATLESFRPLTDRAALRVQPLRLEVQRLDRGMTLAVFNQRYPSQVSLERLALLNRVGVAEVLPAGHRVKRVVGGPLPDRTP